MAQPIFLRNFTLDGVDIGELFVVGTVTMPFMNVERGYYQVGNTSGQTLQYTRLGANTITVNGHLIKDHTGLSVSETKDLLVSQLMSEGTMRMVFDGQPDRYYNVVYEGMQEYDATDLDFTPLTLTFTCPEGVAHSIADDTWLNVAPDLSLGENWLADSDFETGLIWNFEDTHSPTRLVNGHKLLAMDFTDQTLEELDNFEHNYLQDDYWFEFDEPLPAGWTVYARCEYATPVTLYQQTGVEEDKDRTFAMQVEAYDKQNGKLLESFEKDLPDASIVNAAYAYSSNGVDRFTHFLPQPNLIQDGVASERPLITPYQGTTWTRTEGQTVTEWGATNAVRLVSNGGTSTIKGTITSGLRTSDSREYIHSMYVKNNAGTPVVLSNNLGGLVTLQPKESRRVEFPAASRAEDLTPAAIQFIFQLPTTAPIDQVIDVTIWRAKIEENKYGFATEWTDGDLIPEIAGQVAQDNTTPPWVGYSATDTWQEGTNYNLIKGGALRENYSEWVISNYPTAFKLTAMGTHTKIEKTGATDGRATVAQNVVAKNIPITVGGMYTISGDVYIQSAGYSGFNSDTQLVLRANYSDGSFQDIIANVDLSKRDQWQTISGTGTLQNKPISNGTFMFAVTAGATGTINIRDFKLEEGSVKTPFYPSQSEARAMYTWVPYGTEGVENYAPFLGASIWANLKTDKARAFKVRIIQRGNTQTMLNAPAVKFQASVVGGYVRSRKTWRSAIEVENYGTADAYPRFEITNINENGLIGIVNEDGAMLQFGNSNDVDLSEPVKNEDGYHYDWAGKSKPSGTTVNGGHISQYPNMQNNADTPNKVMGNWDYSKKDVIRPAWSSSYVPSAWSGMTIATPVKAPSTGLKTGSFELVERLDFGTSADKRGRYELVIITESNDIIMSATLRDSDPNGSEVLMECWYGNKLLKTIRVDMNKIKGTWFRLTMTRDSAGKKFVWKLEHIQMKKDSKGVERITPVYTTSHTYNAPIANKASISHSSRWLLKYNDGKVSKKVLDKTTHTMKSKEVLNIRTGAGTKYRSVGLLPKNKTFTTTKVKQGQKIINNNKWYYVSKGNGIPASGWVTGYYLTQTKKVDSYKTVVQDAIVTMQVTDSLFKWTGANNQKETKNPFRAGDIVEIDTYTKQIFVNGVEREDLATIGNQWTRFKMEPGKHYLQFVNSSWQSNTMEVKVKLNRRYH